MLARRQSVNLHKNATKTRADSGKYKPNKIVEID